MQLSEFTYIFLTLCIPFLYYIVRSTSPKKVFSILFAVLIALNVFLKSDNFSLLGLFFIAFYLYSYGKKESFYYLSLSFISFSVGFLNEISINTLKSLKRHYTIVFVTHNKKISDYCDNIFEIDKKKIIKIK